MLLRWRGLRRRRRIKPLAHVLARLECRGLLGRNVNGCSGARVASSAGSALLCRECAEASELDTVAFLERPDNFTQNDVDDALEVALVEMRTLGRQLLDEFGLDHLRGFQVEVL